MTLSREQVASYRDNGFVGGIRVMSAAQAAAFADEIERYLDAGIARHGALWRPGQLDPDADAAHPLSEAFDRLGQWPAMLDAVESLLGGNLLIRNADVFVKEPGRWEDGIDWHLDTAATSRDTAAMLSVFIALTETTARNGCIEFSAGTHRRIVDDPPPDKYHLTLSKRAAKSLKRRDTVACPLQPGEISIHHIRTAHRSHWNRHQARRIGFVIRFLTPAVSNGTAESGIATLVRGEAPGQRYMLRPRFPVSWT